MAKSHNVTKGGAVLALVLGATALQNADDLRANIASVGGVVSETICIVTGMTGGIIQLPGGNCTATPTDPNSSGVGG